MPTYPVTGTLTDLGLDALDGDPVLVVDSDDVLPLSSGHLASGPDEFTPAADGTFTLDLASTDDELYGRARYRLRVGVRKSDTYDPTHGHFRWVSPTWHFTVPRGGGRLVDFVKAKVADDVFAILNDPGDQALLDDLYSRGVRVVLDTSTTPASFHRLEA